MENLTVSARDVVDVLRRRKIPVLIAFAGFLLLSILIAFLLPPVYQSKATILVEEQEIPTDLVRSTVTTFANQRMQAISKRVMTRTNMLSIMEKYNLYPDERNSAPEEALLAKMAAAFLIEPVSAEVIDPRSGRPTEATIAFELSFEYSEASAAQAVTSEITSLFLDENIRGRTQAAEEASSFLASESKRLEILIDSLEQKIAVFKKENMNQLPELNQYNLQRLQLLDSELINIDAQIRALRDKKLSLENQLVQIDPNPTVITGDGERILSQRGQLKKLRTDYTKLLSRYSTSHPDLVKMRREIQSLESGLGIKGSSSADSNEIARLRAELSKLTERYSESHPDVVKIKRAIASLESSAKTSGSGSSSGSNYGAENPAYIVTTSQLNSVASELNSMITKKSEIQNKKLELSTSLINVPHVEQEYKALQRRLTNATARYDEVKAKEMQANIAQQLEVERKGERFSLIEPPVFPHAPIKPNRQAIIFLGVIFALASGLGMAYLTEVLDHSIYSGKGVVMALGNDPLAVVPYLEDRRDWLKRRNMKQIQVVAAVTLMFALIASVHFYLIPLEVLWYKGLNALSNSSTPSSQG